MEYDFEGQKTGFSYSPRFNFFGRSIIIETDYGSYVYYNIDDGELKNVDFGADIEDKRVNKAKFIPSDDGELYFSYYQPDSRGYWYDGFGETQVYKVGEGFINTEGLQMKWPGMPGIIVDGFLYYYQDSDGFKYEYYMYNYYNTAEGLVREKLF